MYEGKNLLDLEPDERAREGVFMAFQYPVEVPGVSNSQFLRLAYNEKMKHLGQEELDPLEFNDYLKEKAKIVDMSPEFFKRSVNEGFSGGEKKRNEILQMAVLAPKLAILDETDSGLDIDALRIVAEGVNTLRSPITRSSSSHITSGCSTSSCPIWSTFSPAARSSKKAARNLLSNSKKRATTGSRGRTLING